MPGANYMGGRRNVMKARAKDAIGRQQKGHFSRQRLDMLSKGVSATRPSEMGRAGIAVPALCTTSTHDIDLAHARKISLDDTVSVRSFIPSPIHITPWSPRSHKKARMRASEMHIPSPKTRRSKVLDAVDLSEDLFLRRIADQILAMPNLACLPDRNSFRMASSSGSSQKKKLTSETTSTPIRTEKQKMSVVDDSEEPDPRRKLHVGAKPGFAGYTKKNGQFPCTPPPKKRQRLESSKWNTSPRPVVYQVNRYFSREVPSSSSLVKGDRYYHSTEDSKFDESDFDSEGINTRIRSSSLWSPENRRHSSITSVDDKDFQHNPGSFTPDNSTSQVLEDPSSPFLEEDVDQVLVQQVFDGDSGYLPSVIVLGPGAQRQIGNKDSLHYPTESQTSYGSLFKKDDPWRTIGIILGLPEMEKKRDSPKLPNVEREASIFGMDQNQLWDSPFQNEIDIVAEENQVEKGEPNDNETEDDEMFQMDYEWEVQSPAIPNYKRVIHNNFKAAELPFQDIVSNLDYASSLPHSEDTGMDIDRRASQEMKIVVMDSILDVDRDIDFVVETSTVFQHRKNPEETPRLTVPDRTGEYVMNVDDTDQGCSVETGDKMLSTPELREVDGRFLGPSLFEDCDESDEE